MRATPKTGRQLRGKIVLCKLVSYELMTHSDISPPLPREKRQYAYGYLKGMRAIYADYECCSNHTFLAFAYRENLGSIRLKVSLMEEYVLPSVSYQPLMDLIAEPVTGIPTKGVDAISIMEDMATLDQACVARQLVKIFIGQNSLLSFLDWITNREIQRTSKCILKY